MRDLRQEGPADRCRITLAALAEDGIDHVLGAEVRFDGLVGRPDVVSRIDGRWVAGDVKSGTPYMPDGVRVKDVYGVQIGLYAMILGALGVGVADSAFVIGADGRRVLFDLDAPWGTTTVARMVEEAVARARDVLSFTIATRGAASLICGLCHWRGLCREEFDRDDDLTLVAEIGRSLRSVIEPLARTRTALAALDVAALRAAGLRSATPGLGIDRLDRLRDRAVLQTTPGSAAYARRPLALSRAALEWHLDIEADPLRGGLVYLHGTWERRLEGDGRETCSFHHFFGDGFEGERAAFEGAWRLLASDATARVYYYSRFERTSYRALQRRHPHVCAADDVEAFFSDPRVIDLYSDFVRPHTEWPLGSYGLKPIAKSLGFSWSADDASGASSIGWYDEWLRGGDPAVRDRIVDYNREDCIASAVVLDGLLALPVRGAGARVPYPAPPRSTAPLF